MGEYASASDAGLPLYDIIEGGRMLRADGDSTERFLGDTAPDTATTAAYDIYPQQTDTTGQIRVDAARTEQTPDTGEPGWPVCFKERVYPEAETVTVPDQYSSRIAGIFEQRARRINIPARGERPHLLMTADTPHGTYGVTLYENNDMLVTRSPENRAGDAATAEQGYYINASRYDSGLVVCADESDYLAVPQSERTLHVIEGTDTSDRAIGRQEWKLLDNILETADVEKPTFEALWEAVAAHELDIPSMPDTKDGVTEMRRYIAKAIAAAPERQGELNVHEMDDVHYAGILVAEPEPETLFQHSVVQYTVSANGIDTLGRDVGGPYVNITHIQKITVDGANATTEEEVAGEKSRALIVVAEQRGEVTCMLYEEFNFEDGEIPVDPTMLRVGKNFVRTLRDFLDSPSV